MTAVAPRATLAPILAVLLTAALWSASGLMIKLVGREGGSAIEIACLRSLIGALALAPFALRQLRTLRSVPVGWPIGSVASFTLMTTCFVIATDAGASSTAIVLQYTSALWVFALSPWLLREWPARAEGWALLPAMAGVLVILASGGRGDLPVVAVALASGLGYGVLTLVLRGMRTVDPLVVTTLNAGGSGLLLLGPMLAAGWPALSATGWLLLMCLALFQFCLPYVLFSWALRWVSAGQASLLSLLEIVLNPVWTLLFLAEYPPWGTLAGGPLILLGVALWLWLRVRSTQRRTAQAPG